MSHIPTMKHNLVPPFIMREAGLFVNDVPKIHCQDPKVEDHSIFDPETLMRIPLKMQGIFSYFPTRSLTSVEIKECNAFDTVFLTPDSDSWDPYNPAYAEQEDEFLDYRGEMVYPRPTTRVELIKDVDVSMMYAHGATVEEVERDHVIMSSCHP